MAWLSTHLLILDSFPFSSLKSRQRHTLASHPLHASLCLLLIISGLPLCPAISVTEMSCSNTWALGAHSCPPPTSGFLHKTDRRILKSTNLFYSASDHPSANASRFQPHLAPLSTLLSKLQPSVEPFNPRLFAQAALMPGMLSLHPHCPPGPLPAYSACPLGLSSEGASLLVYPNTAHPPP